MLATSHASKRETRRDLWLIGNDSAGICVLVVSVSRPDGPIAKIDATAGSLNKSIGVVVPIETLLMQNGQTPDDHKLIAGVQENTTALDTQVRPPTGFSEK